MPFVNSATCKTYSQTFLFIRLNAMQSLNLLTTSIYHSKPKPSLLNMLCTYHYFTGSAVFFCKWHLIVFSSNVICRCFSTMLFCPNKVITGFCNAIGLWKGKMFCLSYTCPYVCLPNGISQCTHKFTFPRNLPLASQNITLFSGSQVREYRTRITEQRKDNSYFISLI